MKHSHSILDYLLQTRPDKREELLPYVAKVKQYSNECGCSLGGKFLGAAFLLCALRFLLAGPAAFRNPARQFLFAILFVFFASMAGKLIGIGLAKLRLAHLHRQLIQRYGLKGAQNVHLHKMG